MILREHAVKMKRERKRKGRTFAIRIRKIYNSLVGHDCKHIKHIREQLTAIKDHVQIN